MLGLKKKSILNYYRKEVKKYDELPRVQEKKQVEKALLLFKENDFNVDTVLNSFEQHKEFANVHFDVVCFCDFDKKRTYSENEFHMKQIGYFGKGLSGGLKDRIDTSYDLLVSYNINNDELINYLTLCSKAKFKVGFEGQDGRLNDMLIHVSGYNLEVFNLELIKYLGVLNKL